MKTGYIQITLKWDTSPFEATLYSTGRTVGLARIHGSQQSGILAWDAYVEPQRFDLLSFRTQDDAKLKYLGLFMTQEQAISEIEQKLLEQNNL